jgi:hypothetical protein
MSKSRVSSTNIRSVAADSNVLLSAVAGRAASRVFQSAKVSVVTTDWNVAEVEEYLPTFAKRYGIPDELLVETFALLPVRRYRRSQYSSHLAAARRFLAGRDTDDISLAAKCVAVFRGVSSCRHPATRTDSSVRRRRNQNTIDSILHTLYCLHSIKRTLGCRN